jgi:hypothetical protein
MPDEELLLDDEEQESEDVEELEDESVPGELCPVDASHDRIDLSEDDGSDFTEKEKEGILSNLLEKAAQRDLTSYRLEIRDCWKARYFYRGNQYLLPGKNGAWVLPQLILVGGQSYDDHNQETNIYLAFGDTVGAALTAGVPSVRFEPDDPTNAADVSASIAAEDARKLIERANNMVVLQEDLARFLWTDGRCMVYTHYVIDAQRFGYQRETDVDDELAYLPETEEAEEEKTEQSLSTKGAPRGQEVIEMFGALETKIPMQARDFNAVDYNILSREFDITLMKTKYPKKAKELEPMKTPTANMEYARLARTSIMTGMRPSNMTNDAMTYNATETLGWIRPSFFKEVKDDDDDRKYNWLIENFPKGAMIAMVGKTVCEARNESITDHWTLIHARPGDGTHRPALGSPIIPLQEKLNDCMDLIHESFMHLIPIKWVDSEAIDTEALSQLESKPNQYLKMKRRPDKDIAGNIYVEPQIQLAEGMLVYVEKLFGEFAQFLCGAFPALFGGNTGSNDTASGIASQRDQALGRIGLTWRNIKAGYASIVRQAVMCAAEHRVEAMSGEVTAAGGVKQQIAVDPQDLKGNIRCYPDTDENFPESWVAQRAVWTQLLQAAEKSPVLNAILAIPRNLAVAKDKIGVPELVIPAAAAAMKQAAEIMEMLGQDPLPNPAKLAAKEQAAKMIKENADSAALATLAQAAGALPEEISSVPVDEELDDHAAEMAEIRTWANTPEGIRTRVDDPDAFKNVRLHYDEHKAALAKQQAGQGGPQAKPVNEGLSLNFKDLPPEGQVQAAAKFGIILDAAKLQADEAQDKLAAASKQHQESGGV